MSGLRPHFRALASGFLAGAWTEEGLIERGAKTLGTKPRWLRRLVTSVLTAFPDPPRNTREALAAFLAARPSLHRHLAALPAPLIKEWLVDVPRMVPTRFNVPFIDTSSDLAALCGVDPPMLDWFAARRGRSREKVDALQHYRYAWVPKNRGGYRLLEAPKPRLRSIQRRILRGILDQVPAHSAASAFRRGGSVMAFAAPHTARGVVVRVDLEDFFPSTPGPKVVGLFRELGYPDEVVTSLAGLCTHRIPASVAARCPHGGLSENPGARWRSLKRLQDWHLPQGAPTSPALSNLCAFGLDVRLQAAAVACEARYTRYADDLAFSWGDEVAAPVSHFLSLVEGIIRDEGYRINTKKTRVMRRSRRQVLAGTVINDRVHVSRAERERLEAILTNCARYGPEGQNRMGVHNLEAHLAGRVAWVTQLEPRHGMHLEALFARVAWPRTYSEPQN